MASKKGYTLLEYLVTIEMELKKLKKIVAESVGADYSELIANIDGIRNELNSFKSSITDTVNTNNSNLTSKFNSLEQQFNTFKTSITNTVNTNNTSILSKVNSLETQFNTFKTSITNINERFTNVENRITTLENSGGSSGGSGADLTELQNQVDYLEEQHNYFKNTMTTKVNGLENRVTTLENNSGSSGSIGGTTRTLIHDYTVTEGTILNITNLDITTGQFTTDTNFELSSYTKIATIVKKEGINILSTGDVPKELQASSNLRPTDIIDNTFKLNSTSKYSNTGSLNKYGLLVDGIENYTVNNIFESNKTYEIEVYTSQPLYFTALALPKCINNFNNSLGYALGGEQYSTYLAALGLNSAEGINFVRHQIKLYNYVNSFKIEVDSIFDGMNSNAMKFKYNKFEYFYNGNIMTNLSYQHYRNLIPKGTTIKIYEIGGN